MQFSLTDSSGLVRQHSKKRSCSERKGWTSFLLGPFINKLLDICVIWLSILYMTFKSRLNVRTWRRAELDSILQTPLCREDSWTVSVTQERASASLFLCLVSHIVHLHQKKMVIKHLSHTDKDKKKGTALQLVFLFILSSVIWNTPMFMKNIHASVWHVWPSCVVTLRRLILLTLLKACF